MTGTGWQELLVALAVLASAGYVLHSRAPRASRRLRVAVAIPMVRPGRPAWLQRLGRRLAPPTSSAAAACGSCSGCGPG